MLNVVVAHIAEGRFRVAVARHLASSIEAPRGSFRLRNCPGASIHGSDVARNAGGYLNFATQNTPFINLFYVRPALDYRFLSSLREVASPGYAPRVEGRRKKEYGQKRFTPDSLRPFN